MPTNNNSTDVAIDIDLSAIASAADLAEEEDIYIEAINGARQWQLTTFVSKCVVFTACVALGTLIGASSFHLAGPPTMNVSSSKHVAVASGEIKIDGFTKMGKGECGDEGGQLYDYVAFLMSWRMPKLVRINAQYAPGKVKLISAVTIYCSVASFGRVLVVVIATLRTVLDSLETLTMLLTTFAEVQRH
eukprot:scaffold1336_cov100-Skeletonema_dohrnii-CCMP3373.AAC.11